MRRTERLFMLVQELRRRRVSRAEELAAFLEVSVRTVYRDIADLQSSGLPIEGQAGVGYLLRPGFDLPPVTFTHEQVDALALGLSFAESLDDRELADAAREVRAKLQASMPKSELQALADAPYFSMARTTGCGAHGGLLRRAIRTRRVIRLSYVDADGMASERFVRPLAIWNSTIGWIVSCWCELREDFRTFRGDRIAAVVWTERTFVEDEMTSLAAFLARERFSRLPAADEGRHVARPSPCVVRRRG